MRSATKYLFILFLLVPLIGCGAHSRYQWSGYDTKMYKHYKNPAEREEFVQGLKDIIDKSEPAGKVPPGIYAEYGFVMFEEGNNQQAINYYEKEANKWPESRAFMNKLIAMANNRMKNQKENARPTVIPEVDAGRDVTKTSAEVPK